jgi:hypothetical protein
VRPKCLLNLPRGLVNQNPVPDGFDELQADREASLRDSVAVGDARDRAKRTRERRNLQPVVNLPPARAQHACAAQTHVFGKRCFCAGKRAVARDMNSDFHGNARFTAYRVKRFGDAYPKLHLFVCPFGLQAGCNVIELELSAVPLLCSLHLIQALIGRAQKLFDGRPISRVNRLTDAD